MRLEDEMTEEEKSLALAYLMGWEVIRHESGSLLRVPDKRARIKEYLCPYDGGVIGRSQFAAILLDNMEVLQEPAFLDVLPTQANILDEILRMHGKLK
jgi:hypothetical protein